MSYGYKDENGNYKKIAGNVSSPEQTYTKDEIDDLLDTKQNQVIETTVANFDSAVEDAEDGDLINVTDASGGYDFNVVNNLTSTSTEDALSANMGKVLNEGKADKSTTYTKTEIDANLAQNTAEHTDMQSNITQISSDALQQHLPIGHTGTTIENSLDNYMQVGMYSTATHQGTPTTSDTYYGTLIVFKGKNDGFVTQLLCTYSRGSWVREYDTDGWKSWAKINQEYPIIQPFSDCDDYKASGSYTINSPLGVSHLPYSSVGCLFVSNSGNYIIQLYHAFTNNHMCFRAFDSGASGGTWTPWYVCARISNDSLPSYTYDEASGYSDANALEALKKLRNATREPFTRGSVIHIGNGNTGFHTYFIGSTDADYFKALVIDYYENISQIQYNNGAWSQIRITPTEQTYSGTLSGAEGTSVNAEYEAYKIGKMVTLKFSFSGNLTNTSYKFSLPNELLPNTITPFAFSSNLYSSNELYGFYPSEIKRTSGGSDYNIKVKISNALGISDGNVVGSVTYFTA